VESDAAGALARGGDSRRPDTHRALNANAYAERFVRSIKEVCLNRLIPFGEHHHRRAVAEFVATTIASGIITDWTTN
jgi:hypothetical protein